MERISLSKLLAAVGFLICSSWTPVSYGESKISEAELAKERADCERKGGKWKRERAAHGNGIYQPVDYTCDYGDRDKCREKIDELKEEKGKFLAACRANGSGSVEDCSDIISNCQELASGDFDVSPNEVMKQIFGAAFGAPEGAGGVNKCSDYSFTDWKSDLKDLERDKKDAQKDINDTREKLADAKKSLEEKAIGIQEKKNELEEEKAEKELKDKEEARNIEKGKMESEASLRRKLRELHLRIQQAQMAQSILVESRKSDTKEAERAIKACQKQAKAEIEKSRSNTSNSLANRSASTKVVTKSLGAAKSAKSLRKQEMADAMQDCVEKATDALNLQRKRHQAEMKKYADDIANANEEMKEVNQSIDLLAKHAAEAALDRANKQSRDQMNLERKKALKDHELQMLSKQYSESEARFGAAIYQAESSMNQAQQKIVEHMKEKPMGKGSKNPREEMKEAQKGYVGKTCKVYCEDASQSLQNECARVMGKTGKKFDEDLYEGVKGAE